LKNQHYKKGPGNLPAIQMRNRQKRGVALIFGGTFGGISFLWC